MSESSIATVAPTPTADQSSLISFPPPSKPNEYRALGLVKGYYLPDQNHDRSGVLVTNDQPFPARISLRLANPPASEAIWRVWMRTTSDEQGLQFFLKSYFRDQDKTPLDPNLLQQDRFSIRGQLIWWNQKEEDDKRFAIRIVPNRPKYAPFNPFYLVIYGKLSRPRAGAFWEIVATRQGNRLVFQEGREVYPPKKKQLQTKTIVQTVTTDELHAQVVEAVGKEIGKSTVSRWLSQGKMQERLASYCGKPPFEVEFAEKSGNKNFYHLKRTVKTQKKKPKAHSPQSTQPPPIPKIMVQGRTPEITVKFTQRIELPAEGKKVSIEVQGENDIRVKAMVNRKTLKKQVAKMDEFEDWVGALSGKIAQIGSDGVIELESAGVQVFEKKKKQEASSVEKPAEG